MRLLIIRHADPDYSIDSLTEQGWIEAEALSEKLKNEKMDAIYTSQLGRAKDTAAVTLKKIGRESDGAFSWLNEFPPIILKGDHGEKGICWDWLPADWTKEPCFFDKDRWFDAPMMQAADVKSAYERVTKELDALLANHGYEREGGYYRAARPNSDTIVLFCHFGLGCVLLSHLLNVSPMILWHGLCAAPSSVTTLTTEERRPGAAYFRMNSYGDISHLYAKGEKPSFSARFCELYSNKDERHD